MEDQSPRWAEITESYARRLVSISSVSPGPGETEAAREALAILREHGMESAYAESGLHPLAGDEHGRSIAYALVRGGSATTLVVLGHVDTVGTADYGALEADARSPDALARRFAELRGLAPDVDGFDPAEWMYGRGAADMKSGVAAMLAATRHLAACNRRAPIGCSVIAVATVDEENESAGVIAAIGLLIGLRERHGLDFAGAINTDYVSERFPGDTARPVYAGTVGKLLPSFLAIGRAGHAGNPFEGVDANLVMAELIRDLSLNPDLADISEGVAAAPPVSLRAGDLKERYDTQLALSAHLALNLVTVRVTPVVVLEQLRLLAEQSLRTVGERARAAETRWRKRAGLPASRPQAAAASRPQAAAANRRRPAVHTYAEVAQAAGLRSGGAALRSALDDARAGFSVEMDSRRRCLELVQAAWRLSGLAGPAIVIYFAPPYYPHLAPRPSRLLDALQAMVAAHPELNLVYEPYFPLLSDLSYLGYQEGGGLEALIANLPIWQTGPESAAGYSIPLDEIRRLDLPVVNLGPFGFGVHQAGERVHRAYSFGALPQLIVETIERVAEAD